VGGMNVQPGDLIQGDLHGVLTIPREIADRIPAAADDILRKRQTLIELCRSKGFTVEKLREAVERIES
jgi:regulator of RNase E activity RraA